MITNTRYGIAGGQWQGLSTDDKPQNADINDLFLELDTGDFYYLESLGGTTEEVVWQGTLFGEDSEPTSD